MPYITVTVHYVNDKWEMCSFIIATRSMEEKHTGENIKSFTREILEEMGAWRTDNYYVTDNGSNVKAAFKDQNWIPCCGHNLNLVLTHSLDGRDAPDSVLEIINLIGTCKEIVTHIKRSKIQHELQTTVKQSVSTRWNSQLTMLKSVQVNIKDITSLSTKEQDKKLQRKLLDLNETLLNDVITVLTPFDTATKHLSTDKEFSLHMVVATKHKLLKELLVLETIVQ